ncbi:class I SAM-dependent methyltransferase [Defluviimonas sp. WL0075]|uniref:Class I SAM-dependent methyltransferase n=1 Tax=Albidovulum sediminicola TaxID=2984331 RepID=A0ABT2Z4D2_9RHOB|nr:class I SAM-dependent methyltransferase [Defluviimonas sp. WL0075]MCV2865971.1 class I SAM-dependent methyltransferase [Defluviimonas sp. WL0075]
MPLIRNGIRLDVKEGRSRSDGEVTDDGKARSEGSSLLGLYSAFRRMTRGPRQAIRKTRALYLDMALEERSCTLCEASDFTLLAQSARYGFDLDVEAIAFARAEYGHDFEVASFPSRLAEGPKVSILPHVREHVHDPKAFLAEVRERMSPDDYLLVEVPGLNAVAEGAYGRDLWAYFHIAHVTDFTAGTLGALAHVAGFEIVRINETVTALLRKSASEALPWERSPTDTVGNVVRVGNARKARRA